MANIVLQVSDLCVDHCNCTILEDISFECFESEWTLLCGPSGSGKSTLLRAVNALCPIRKGYIRVLETLLPGRSRQDARRVWRQTGTFLQEVALFETLTAIENVEIALHGDRNARKRALAWLECLNLGNKLQRYPAQLSGGEQQRVALARAFAHRPRLLLLDEPTSALDRETAQCVLAAIKDLCRTGTAVLMSTHRVSEVQDLCDHVINLRNGHMLTTSIPVSV
jgi:ABC-type polar amino acid transport system ATPase subunit